MVTQGGIILDPIKLERSTTKKVTLRLIPFLFLCFTISILDRVNIGFAALQMNEDLGFSNAVFGLGAGIFFLGYFLLEVPGSAIMTKVGARRWISRIMITWASNCYFNGLYPNSMAVLYSKISFRSC